MTDREYLELAAKAVGIDIEWQPCGWAHDNNTGCEWNPITDDGDALRLAVKLCLMIDIRRVGVTSVWTDDDSGAVDFDVAHDGDPLAATRRAIVRAAAEIGRSMK